MHGKERSINALLFHNSNIECFEDSSKSCIREIFCRPSDLVFDGFFVESEPNGRFGDVYILTPACLPAAKKT